MWRSSELNSLFSRLDRKGARKRSQRSASVMIERKDGPPSTREAPEDFQFSTLAAICLICTEKRP